MDQIGTSPVTDIPDFHSRGYLPHIENKMLQVITIRLYDSVPRKVIDQWKDALSNEGNAGDLARKDNNGQDMSYSADDAGGVARGPHKQVNDAGEVARGPFRAPQNKDVQMKLRKLIDDYEDSGYGQCFFRDKRIAEIMESTLYHYEGRYYQLVRWVIMPNHVHVMIDLKSGVKLSTIVQRWKSYTAHAANRLLSRKGDFWMPDFYDRYIRDLKHMINAIAYIDANPVKAGLAESPTAYRWSSAYHEEN